MKQQLRINLIILIGVVTISGCIGIETEMPPPPSVSEPMPEPTEPASDAATPSANSEVEEADGLIAELTFDGQGDTFLEAIDEAMNTLGKPTERRFWDGIEDVKPRLQGEILTYPEGVVLFAQLAQDGGSQAVRIDAPSVEDAMALLKSASRPIAEPSSAPDAEITFVNARSDGDGVWSFDVSVDHPDTGWEDYTDGWHVETPDGVILGTRILIHPHVGERPFTRSARVTVPDGVDEIHIRSHDLISGYSYETVVVPIGEAGSGDKYEVNR